jgi:glucosamine--fructose-6-phosphate aminotransferase (isomerizing)
MCGIIGYIGFRKASAVLIDSLKRLEYRGYDSAGIAVINHDMKVEKKSGYVSALQGNMEGHVGIGHTRWATHGEPSDRNAHPFTDCKNEFAIVHNGIIENHMELKKELIEKGHSYVSDTDSEVIAHLIEEEYKNTGDFRDAFIKAINRLKGSFAIAAIHKDEKRIMGAKRESPLIVGLGDGENFLASDVPAFLPYTNRVVIMEDGDVCEICSDTVRFYDMEGNEIKKNEEYVDWSPESAEKSGYEHFMLKEIFEQPIAIENTIHSLFSSGMDLPYYGKISIVACGTSYNAGYAGKYLMERMLNIPVDVHYSSEYRTRPKLRERTLAIFITQSGETADTLAAAKLAKKRGIESVGITNVLGSSITHHVDHVIYTSTGPEIGVAATKTFTAQMAALYYLSVDLAERYSLISKGVYDDFINEFRKVPRLIEKTLLLEDEIKKIAHEIHQKEHMFYLGRGMNYPIAMEGALKMKEISYIHAEAYPAGELKHGPLALISKGTPVVAIVSKDETYEKMISNIKEVSARGAYVIAISSEKELESYVDRIISVPESDPLFSTFSSTVAIQLLAYHTAKLRGCEIDKPRNLAKSVTVE